MDEIKCLPFGRFSIHVDHYDLANDLTCLQRKSSTGTDKATGPNNTNLHDVYLIYEVHRASNRASRSILIDAVSVPCWPKVKGVS
uniref:hypothetical protein n=1 Tax=Serratia quinivorans TaxID=137545 RepID=UPI0035C7731F